MTAAGVGDGGGVGAVCSVFCGLLVLFIAALASSELFPPSRWAVGQRLRARYPPVCFLVEKNWFGTGPAKNPTYLPGVCVAIRYKFRLLPLHPIILLHLALKAHIRTGHGYFYTDIGFNAISYVQVIQKNSTPRGEI